MNWQTRILFLVIGLAIVGATVALIRKRRLRDEYAVLWVCTGLVFLVAVLLPRNLVQSIAEGLDMNWGAAFSIISVALGVIVVVTINSLIQNVRDLVMKTNYTEDIDKDVIKVYAGESPYEFGISEEERKERGRQGAVARWGKPGKKPHRKKAG